MHYATSTVSFTCSLPYLIKVSHAYTTYDALIRWQQPYYHLGINYIGVCQPSNCIGYKRKSYQFRWHSPFELYSSRNSLWSYSICGFTNRPRNSTLLRFKLKFSKQIDWQHEAIKQKDHTCTGHCILTEGEKRTKINYLLSSLLLQGLVNSHELLFCCLCACFQCLPCLYAAASSYATHLG
jgi:hypothetical protein